jgi:dihydrofolate reductase
MYTAVAAMDKNRVIGRSVDDQIPWRFSKDFAWFKKQTLNKTVIMWANTFKSLDYKPLLKRQNIVLSRTLDPKMYPEVLIYNSLMGILANHPEAHIIGGGEIYKLFSEKNLLDEAILTEIDGEFGGDVKLPFIEKGMRVSYEEEITDINKKDGKEYNLKFVSYKG